MKIGYFADGPWSHKALELISKTAGLEIVFIVPRFDLQDPVLKDWAIKLDVPYLPTRNVNTEDFLSVMENFEPDLLVSMSFNQILKKEIIDYAPKGFVNCHAGALPFYRGRNPLNWVLINGEHSFGITVHYVDEGIDTGDIVEQRMYSISKKDNYQSLLNRAVIECANILHSAVLKISHDDVERVKQEDIHPVGTYFGIRTFGDELVDFNWEAKRIFNFVRAISKPGPCGRFFIGSHEYAIERVELIPEAPSYIATTGEVVGRNLNGSVVKVGDSTILITCVSDVLDGKLSAPYTPKFKIGTRINKRAYCE
ncbi:methionyl-tRNA formyltransferase [Shewanella psychrophila]|uniref:Methionyl-tRNA formyltransferase n=1 Tax=Shewanella psychrophila TaxID=225848 RepID=A0A1S6HTH4_9GAMM|nr:formyltransferase family protein [Shewanella psychrophila]AQS38856.1 methionyl-tRNA formyltransferase [Shewanella psychrophila]